MDKSANEPPGEKPSKWRTLTKSILSIARGNRTNAELARTSGSSQSIGDSSTAFSSSGDKGIVRKKTRNFLRVGSSKSIPGTVKDPTKPETTEGYKQVSAC
ncbi:hypothetical protein QCA50_020160 [Cerrena zonata]|uniref:Uncharacterized protein n=1 Tax=Cerrena zonata TaxID=2478898 RepID=A0AAW0FCC9_9APHY